MFFTAHQNQMIFHVRTTVIVNNYRNETDMQKSKLLTADNAMLPKGSAHYFADEDRRQLPDYSSHRCQSNFINRLLYKNSY